MAKETNKQQSRYWHSDMKYRDIKKMAIEMGMPFPDVVNGDFYALVSYIDSHREVKLQPQLVEEFDNWMEGILLARGADYLVKPSLRLGYISEERRERLEGSPQEKKIKKEKRVKKIVQRDENNLIKGTKKSYTFELAKKGWDIDRIKRRVLKKFPDASEKSIVIWFRAAMGLKNKPKAPKEPKKKKPIVRSQEAIEQSKKRSKEKKEKLRERRMQQNEITEATRKAQAKRKRKKTKKAL